MALIYVVEDDKNISEIESFALKNAGHQIVECASGKEFHKQVIERIPDLILLDIMLPDEDGLQILTKMRATPETRRVPVILVTAKTTEIDKVKGLDMGADDYLTKPFSVEELLARLRVMQRRIALLKSDSEINEKSVYTNGRLKIDYAAGCAYIEDAELKLTPIEYKLLCLLAQNTGKVLTHKYITQKIWGSAWDSNVASLRVFMATLRKKLEDENASVVYIQTHVGIGYRMLKVDAKE